MPNRAIPFRPRLEGDFRVRFYEKASQITACTTPIEIEQMISQEVEWVEHHCALNISQRRKYRAVWLLLRDLIRASWKASFSNGILEMHLPSLEKDEISSLQLPEVKSLLRKWMQESRLERLDNFKDFIARMEKRTEDGPIIGKLIADGQELYDRLSKSLNGEAEIAECVRPYLQLVDENSKDEFTGLRLSEIWRYFRLSWSTPAETTPGRTIQYLIRDAAHPNHAVMGIASLENCAVQITCRDDNIGWTSKSFVEKLKTRDDSAYSKAKFDELLRYLETGIDGIDWSDLCSQEEIDSPTATLIQRLNEAAQMAEADRQEILKRAQNDTILRVEEKSELGSISHEAEIALFKRKRADQLSKSLNAKRILADFVKGEAFDTAWLDFIESESGSSVIRSALIAQKTQHIGSSMMELNICGAIPPYNDILAGKLVALLALSPKVINDYKERYVGRKSEIASRLKNQAVCRAADLVYIGTTSLYYVGSSQYNRLKIPKDIGNGTFDVKWTEIGKTIGFGTMHISKATTHSLSEATTDDRGYSNINHVFGEGASPKMRLISMSIRELLETTQEDTRDLTKHAMSRIVYGAQLAQNTKEYLLGEASEPQYYYDGLSSEQVTEDIISYWRSRWMASRIKYRPALERIQSFNRMDFLISNELSENDVWKFERIKEDTSMDTPEANPNGLEFIRGFYRGSSSFADYTDLDLLKRIHVSTILDEAIVEAANQRKDVVLTGNPGDGKTHLIRVLDAKLQSIQPHPIVELDASCLSSEEIFERWKGSNDRGVSYVIAINAAVLLQLHEDHGDYPPIADAFKQMMSSVIYHNSDKYESSVVTFDLSKRNVLSDDIVAAVIKKITDASGREECARCKFQAACNLEKRSELLRSEMFQERLSAALSRVSLLGYHATLREVQGLASYLFLGDRDCDSLIKTSSLDEYDITTFLYKGKGKLFEAIQKAFDPVRISYPNIDEELLQGRIDPHLWSEGFCIPDEAMDSNNTLLFQLRKRQFYFFNQLGSQLLEINNDDASNFQHFLALPDKECIKDLLMKLNSFFGSARTGTELKVWIGHRYNTSPRKMLLSLGALERKRFSIGHPQIMSPMSAGIALVSDHLRLEVRGHENIYLKVDYDLYCLLLEAERGVPMLFVENDAPKKIWRFIEQLQEFTDYRQRDELDISVLDVQTKKEIIATIDMESKQYISIQQLRG